jgi:hypothetical protein
MFIRNLLSKSNTENKHQGHEEQMKKNKNFKKYLYIRADCTIEAKTNVRYNSPNLAKHQQVLIKSRIETTCTKQDQ